MDRIRKAVMTLNGLAGLLEGVVPERLEGRPTFFKGTIGWIGSGEEPGDKTRQSSEIGDDVSEAIAAKYDRREEITLRGR